VNYQHCQEELFHSAARRLVARQRKEQDQPQVSADPAKTAVLPASLENVVDRWPASVWLSVRASQERHLDIVIAELRDTGEIWPSAMPF
jgi:hypothetical protein